MLAQIEAQRAYFASDEHIKDRAAIWRDCSPEECLAATIEQCRMAEMFLAMQPPEVLERVIIDTPLPPDAIAILEALQRDR